MTYKMWPPFLSWVRAMGECILLVPITALAELRSSYVERIRQEHANADRKKLLCLPTDCTRKAYSMHTVPGVLDNSMNIRPILVLASLVLHKRWDDGQ
jgi:hypothetical protein